MSTFPKHFGLKPKEETYMLNELEKVRQETKKDFLRFQRKLASKPAIDGSSVHSLPVPGPAGRGSQPWRARPPAKGPALSATALLREALGGAAGPGQAAAPGKAGRFSPRDFYLRSSAFLRLRPPRKPPVIASGVGTAKPAVLLPPPPPPKRPVKRRARRARWSPQPPPPRRDVRPKRVPDASQEAARPARLSQARGSKASRASSEDGESEAGRRRRRVRICSRFVCREVSKEERKQAEPESHPPRDAPEGGQLSDDAAESLQPSHAIPKSIDQIMASLQSEAQLASDETIRELIQSVLGQNYDLAMEDISLIGKRFAKSSVLEMETAQTQSEHGLQMSVEELQMSMLREPPESMSSIFQLDQKDLEWGDTEIEAMLFKSQESLKVQQAEELSKPLEDKQPTSDSKAAEQVPLKVKKSEFLQIKGKEVKRIRKSKSEVSPPIPRKCLKPPWDPKLQKKIPRDYSIPHLHDLCTSIPARQLPTDLRLASRVVHTADKKSHRTLLRLFGTSFSDVDFTDEEQRDRILHGIPVMDDKLEHIHISLTPPRTPSDLVQRTGRRAHQPHLQILGEEMCAYPGCTKIFWNTTAPKFSVPESVMKETLYPKYESVQTSKLIIEKFVSGSRESVITVEHGKSSFRSFLLRKSASYENTPKHVNTESPELKRTKSAIDIWKKESIAPLEIKYDMRSSMKEVMFQKAKELERQLSKQRKAEELISVKEDIDVILENIQDKQYLRHLSLSLIEASRQAGISYIVYPKKTKMKWKKGLKFQKFAIVYEELSKPPKVLKRSTSHGILPGQKKYLLKVPLYERPIRCPSLPACFNFEKFLESKGGIPENSDPQAWAIGMLTEQRPQRAPVTEKAAEAPAPRETKEVVKEPPKLELSDSVECNLSREVIKHYEAEVAALTEEINSKKTYPAFAYCRRGAIYRKLGKLQSAKDDLEEAILLEPLFLNAYWHRHFIYLFQDKIEEALDDLNFINKYDKNNTEAYLSKAEIFKGKKNITMAILNYSQAIKCRPTDADIYFRRAEMYEIENRILAIDDYSKCIYYDPKRTDALLKRGLYYFEYENWVAAIQDFTGLLKIDPHNSEARIYRGRAYYKRNLYMQATQDFSFAIHLDPNNWLALYYRACSFRKCNPLRALQDYSVSVLINDGYENLSCFLHRGIVYANQKLWFLAICDFETVISLERTIVLAYNNIGLIHLLYLDNYTEAIYQFSEAIKLDPSYIQSYLCRAEAFSKMHRLKSSVKELSRAIHLQPDGIQLYIIRGQYLLMMKCYELAKFTIYQVAEMDKGLLELSPVQKALIYSFCENHEKALQVLDGTTLSRPDITMYALLAKAQMKAKRIKEAMKIFKKALDAFSHSDKGPNATAVSADCLYHLGLCYMEEGNLQMAIDSFTKAVKANPELAECFYQRGLCKVKLHKDNSILDFNRAITLNPKHYQAYLSRVAFYGSKGRYSKAILSCNEAIRIYPGSVRAYLCRGVLKFYNKTYKLAVRDLSTAIKMDKKSYAAYYNRALCYTKIKELQLALTDYGVVLLLDAGETITLNSFINRGLIYSELEQYGFALEDFKEAILMNQTNVSLWQAAAMCHHRIKEFEEAIHCFTCAIKNKPRYLDAYNGRGNSYMKYGDSEFIKKAQKDFLKAMHFDPSYIKARISLGYSLQAQGKFQKAWRHFTIATEIDPKSYLAYEGRAIICLQMGNNFAAMKDISTAMKINTKAEFLTNRGVIHEFMGQRQNAMRDYQAAILLNPKYPLAYFNAGNIYFHHRQFSQASDYFSKALKFDPGNKYVLMNRAAANTLLKKYEEAEEDFACVIECCPSWAAVYFNRAQLYCCLKQYELAEKDLSKALSLIPNDAVAYNFRAKVRGKIGMIEEAVADYNQALDLEEYASVT
ncbi:tetratricopeptide repeat protein 6 [Nycticebus coucang]|uniref:tetratricopeptide repeat protein 6 n=1 Tax=Nycticebus coucang TaxID=9470 RepID=UPI00234DAC17|nr:tetratricopeptide repeat protein 6 [Nycticebus coucang]